MPDLLPRYPVPLFTAFVMTKPYACRVCRDEKPTEVFTCVEGPACLHAYYPVEYPAVAGPAHFVVGPLASRRHVLVQCRRVECAYQWWEVAMADESEYKDRAPEPLRVKNWPVSVAGKSYPDAIYAHPKLRLGWVARLQALLTGRVQVDFAVGVENEIGVVRSGRCEVRVWTFWPFQRGFESGRPALRREVLVRGTLRQGDRVIGEAEGKL